MKTTSAASTTFPARSFFRMFAVMLCAVFCLCGMFSYVENVICINP